jgi:ribonuclease HI
VSHGATGSGSRGEAGNILRVLAKKLSDRVLTECFHDVPPAEVRRLMRETADAVSLPEKKGRKASSQPSLWQGTAEDWQGPLQGKTLHLYTDGASRGNPGEAGAGAAIFDEEGKELVAAEKYLGQCTNNEAEYRALLLGLSRCGELGTGRLKVHLDSELIVKQVRGVYRVKHPNLTPLFKEVQQLLAGFASYTIHHVRREHNSRADQLANKAIDGHFSSR